MARPTLRQDPAALIERIERSRGAVGGHLLEVRRALDVPGRIKHSIRRRPFAWFGGSMGIGLLASRLFRRPRKAVKRSGWSGLLLTGTLALLKPILKGVITSELQRRFIRHAEGEEHPTETRFPLSKS